MAFCCVCLRCEKLFWSHFFFFFNFPLWENKQEVWLECKRKTIFCLQTMSHADFCESFASAVLNCFKKSIDLISELRLGKIWSAAVWPRPSQTQSQSGSERSGGGPSERQDGCSSPPVELFDSYMVWNEQNILSLKTQTQIQGQCQQNFLW